MVGIAKAAICHLIVAKVKISSFFSFVKHTPTLTHLGRGGGSALGIKVASPHTQTFSHMQ